MYKENAPSNKTQWLTESINVDIQVFDTLNQLFRRGSSTQIYFSKIKGATYKTLFFVAIPFYILHSIFLKIKFTQDSFRMERV